MTPERKALSRAMKVTGVSLGILALISGAIAWGVGGPGSAGAAVAGVAVAAFVGLSTQAAMFVGARLSPTALLGIVLGSFIVKAAVLIVVLWTVGGSDLSKVAFTLPLVVGAIATLVIDLVVVGRAHIPYVTPAGRVEPG